METPHREDLPILTKTYPLPSTKYRETCCICAVNREGELRRLYPVPFRFLRGDKQFARWEWISAEIHKASGDSRPESYKINPETIIRNGKIPPGKGWTERRRWFEPHVVASDVELEERRKRTHETFGILGPVELIGLDIEAEKEKNWTAQELANLTKEGFFDEGKARERPLLQKIPFSFRYRYRCPSDPHEKEENHKITDWEISALYLTCVKTYGKNWEEKFRAKLEGEFSRKKDVYLLLGTVSNHPHRWIIAGVIYPPQVEPVKAANLDTQFKLF